MHLVRTRMILLLRRTQPYKRILAIPYIQNIYASAIDENSSAVATAEITDILRTSHKLKAADEDDFMVRTQAELINTFQFYQSAVNGIAYCHCRYFAGNWWYWYHEHYVCVGN